MYMYHYIIMSLKFISLGLNNFAETVLALVSGCRNGKLLVYLSIGQLPSENA